MLDTHYDQNNGRMVTPNDRHQAAMFAWQNGMLPIHTPEQTLALLEEGYRIEKELVEEIYLNRPDLEPTRSILMTNVATMAYNLMYNKEARQFALAAIDTACEYDKSYLAEIIQSTEDLFHNSFFGRIDAFINDREWSKAKNLIRLLEAVWTRPDNRPTDADRAKLQDLKQKLHDLRDDE